ncbi:MAG TPA: glycosyltransferase, partial [Solirubrobacteraceae bacterium]|nr:glycosyltransferase [Solirubrobacteraceae bacterium]
EEARLPACLAALRDDPDVTEVVVVDDRSSDATAAVARAHGARVVAGAEPPAGWVGKPWALQQGVEAARGDVVVTLDADVRPRPGLLGALATELDAADLVSAGGRFTCESVAERLLHPSMLATLVYRFGPQDAEGFAPSPARAVVNGQCLAFRRGALLEAGGFGPAAAHMTDDIALARALARRGWRLRFADGAGLLDVRMYESAAETWHGWGRSLAMPDATAARWQAADLAVLALTFAAPPLRLALRRGTALDGALLAVRAALLGALARSYAPRGLSFWLSPLADPAVMLRYAQSVLRPAREWRGRRY